VGVNGSVGQGKTFFSEAIASRLNALLHPEEGQAITRSLDDYYLTKAERSHPEFLARGYCPQGISNRGPAGTHDTRRLKRDINALENSSLGSQTRMPVFDKSIDDRSPVPYVAEGKIGIFIFEGWFVGAYTKVDVSKTKVGLQRSVAIALGEYAELFQRLDMLIAFEPWKGLSQINAQRLEQEETLRKQTGKAGMGPDQIRRLVHYFYRESWQDGVSSPFPLREAANFWLKTTLHHRFVSVQPPLPSF